MVLQLRALWQIPPEQPCLLLPPQPFSLGLHSCFKYPQEVFNPLLCSLALFRGECLRARQGRSR